MLCANKSGVTVCYEINEVGWETQYESDEIGSDKIYTPN